MSNLTIRDAQDRAWSNKVTKDFNTIGAVRVSDAWRKDPPSLGAELTDAQIFLAGLAEMAGVDLEAETTARLAANKARSYERLPNGTHVKTGDPQ